MLAGDCVGVSGVGDCVGTGWSPNWLPPLAFSSFVDGVLNSLDEVVCPFCVLDRVEALPNPQQPPGFNRQKYQRIRGFLSGLNCFADPAAQPGHTHLFDFGGENVWPARPDPPGPDERGF